MKTRYSLTDTTEDHAGTWPDCLSVPIRSFKYKSTAQAARLTQVDVDRFDLFLFNHYNSLDYIDIILWLNNLGSIRQLQAGDTIKLPAKSDLDSFYIKNRKV
jgi:hypothetical protein